jgi:hypothetical protein
MIFMKKVMKQAPLQKQFIANPIKVMREYEIPPYQYVAVEALFKSEKKLKKKRGEDNEWFW